jgi:hypothetical protein
MSKLRFGPPPTPAFDVVPKRSEIEFFRENGFLVVKRLTSDEEVVWLRKIFEFIFDPRGAPGAPLDRSGTLAPGEPIGCGNPFFRKCVSRILESSHRRNAKLTPPLLEVDESRLTSWGHMIYKPPGGRAAPGIRTVYWLPELGYLALGTVADARRVDRDGRDAVHPRFTSAACWCTATPTSPNTTILIVDAPFDESTAVASAQGGRRNLPPFLTLHYTAPNATDQPRLVRWSSNAPTRRKQRGRAVGRSGAPRRTGRSRT